MVWILPLAALGLLAGALALAPDRRRGWLWVGVAVAVTAVVPLVSLNIARDPFAANVYALSGIDTSAGYAFYDIVLRFLVNAFRTVAMLGIVVAVASWLSGPARASVALREAVGRAVSGVSSGTEFGAFGVWVREHKGLMRLAGVGLAVLVLVLWNAPTPGVILGLGIFVALWLILVEFFGRGPAEELAAADVSDAAGAPEDPRD
jgi:hypothetical protein